jgi:hypothetical protein
MATGKVRRLRIVTRHEPTVDEIEDAALDLDWLPVGSVEATEEHPALTRWLDGSEQTSIDYVEDAAVGLRYFDIAGPRADDVGQDIHKAFDVYTPAEALAALRDAAPADRPAAVLLAGLGAGPAGPDLVAALTAAAADPAADVRRATVLATGYLGWPDLLDLLTRLERDDPDPDVREDATSMLQILDELVED